MENNINLTNNEKYFLRLLVHNFDDDYISDFLKIQKSDLGYIRGKLKIKFKTKDWVVLIKKAFALGILNKQDYIDPTINKIALGYASKIFDDFKNRPYGYKLPQEVLSDFDHSCNNFLSKTVKITLK
ncbi:hypothetical protein Q4Q39_08735 [Flavivirga amylovorans]|uniref:Uncharacterized protein n=1 Tax=Flavivirga amylovorans TaxID=870486 RepID=A0ABT8X0M6_9FLAO|nr:hypothetical protein [Flavivirga amylovorans]MDO5987479.1 hypothetical protein [Flavivirga amylovorans]